MTIIIKITDKSRTLARPGAVTVSKSGENIELEADGKKIVVPLCDLKKVFQALEILD